MKNLLLVGLLFVINTTFAQIISYDNSFASNGKHTVPTINNNNIYSTRIVQNQDQSIYYTYNESNPTSGIPECNILKLNSDGSVDTSFGNNGKTVINNYIGGVQSELKKQPDGKILLMCFYDNGSAIVRLLPNGQPDTTFGINGVSRIDNIGTDFNSVGYGFYIQNNKIIVYGQATNSDTPYIHYKSIYRLNNDGSIDTNFGNNGLINTAGNFIFVDNQSNIISFISNHNNTNAYTYGALEKYDSNGSPFSGFGNNGILTFTASPGFVNTAFMDSNNNIVCANINNEIFRINPNGTVDNSFSFNHDSFTFDGWDLSLNFVEKNGNYYISGLYGLSRDHFFISKLTSTGSVDSIFSYYSEVTANYESVGEMIVNDNSLIAVKEINGASKKIVKFLLNTSVLATQEFKNNASFEIENPVRESLIFKTKESVQHIQIYSMEGKLVKTLKENNFMVSELLRGTYIAKIIFNNGKIISKKLLKN